MADPTNGTGSTQAQLAPFGATHRDQTVMHLCGERDWTVHVSDVEDRMLPIAVHVVMHETSRTGGFTSPTLRKA